MGGSDPIDASETVWPSDPVERAAAVAGAGLRQPVPAELPAALAELIATDADARVRAAALGALARLPDPPPESWTRAASDADSMVRGRAADLSPAFAGGALEGGVLGPGLLALLADQEASVAEAAAWALGELSDVAVAAGAVGPLAEVAGMHGDPLVREAAVAALGSVGDPAGLDAVLSACRDKPPIRRRAVLALAAFEGPPVEAALREALDDRDWQTRQAAEDLLRGDGAG